MKHLRKVATKIRLLARDKNISDRELCEILNITEATLSSIYLGIRPFTWEQVRMLSNKFGISLNDMLDTSNITDKIYSEINTDGKQFSKDSLDRILDLICDYVVLKQSLNNFI